MMKFIFIILSIYSSVAFSQSTYHKITEESHPKEISTLQLDIQTYFYYELTDNVWNDKFQFLEIYHSDDWDFKSKIIYLNQECSLAGHYTHQVVFVTEENREELEYELESPDQTFVLYFHAKITKISCTSLL